VEIKITLHIKMSS